MKKYKVTAFWGESYQSCVVESKSAESAKSEVRWVESSDGIYPDRVVAHETNETLGLKPYVHKGPRGLKQSSLEAGTKKPQR